MNKIWTLTLALLLVAATVSASDASAGVRGCGYSSGFYVGANSYTSCPFAFNTARKFARGSRNPVVYSPVTGRYYRMHCSRVGSRRWGCWGGNHAYVRLTYT